MRVIAMLEPWKDVFTGSSACSMHPRGLHIGHLQSQHGIQACCLCWPLLPAGPSLPSCHPSTAPMVLACDSRTCEAPNREVSFQVVSQQSSWAMPCNQRDRKQQ